MYFQIAGLAPLLTRSSSMRFRRACSCRSSFLTLSSWFVSSTLLRNGPDGESKGLFASAAGLAILTCRLGKFGKGGLEASSESDYVSSIEINYIRDTEVGYLWPMRRACRRMCVERRANALGRMGCRHLSSPPTINLHLPIVNDSTTVFLTRRTFIYSVSAPISMPLRCRQTNAAPNHGPHA